MPGSASGSNNEDGSSGLEEEGTARNPKDLERPQGLGMSGKGSRSTGSALLSPSHFRRSRASRSIPGSKPGVTSGILGFWVSNWFTQDQVSVPGTQNTPEMSLYSPGHHLGHGTGWRNTWQGDTRVGMCLRTGALELGLLLLR